MLIRTGVIAVEVVKVVVRVISREGRKGIEVGPEGNEVSPTRTTQLVL